MKGPQKIEMSAAEIHALKHRAATNQLTEEDRKTLIGVLECVLWLQHKLSQTRLSMKRLRDMLFGAKTEKRRKESDEPADEEDLEASDEKAEPSSDEATSGEGPPESAHLEATVVQSTNPQKPKGHGRNGAKAYPGATIIHVPSGFKDGDPCPVTHCTGHLYGYTPGVLITMRSSGLFEAQHYRLERLRCTLCGTTALADLPAGVTREKYDARARVMVCVMKYYLGVPFYRSGAFQETVGAPLPDAVQWELAESVGLAVTPIYEALIAFASNADVMWADDTHMRVLSLMKENREQGRKRTGMYTTGIACRIREYLVYLYITGRDHAGENMMKLVAHRDPQTGRGFYMADASSRNAPLDSLDDLMAKFILCLCLIHARRNFYELRHQYEEANQVLDDLAKIYHHEALCRQKGMTARERLNYHQVHSKPIMVKLRQWLKKLLRDKQVEPNSNLGQAIGYMLRNWERLTQFLRHPGAPLDNNVAERMLKVPIRNRNNAYFYKTLKGARIGDIMMSIMHTCQGTNVNMVEYLVACYDNREAVAKDPTAWFPWNYEQALHERAEPLKAA